MGCRGFDSYAGPCGAEDCSTCRPSTYRRHTGNEEIGTCKCGCCQEEVECCGSLVVETPAVVKLEKGPDDDLPF